MSKLKVCKYCRSEIDKKASVCPCCKKRQPHGCLFNIVAVASVCFIFYVTGTALMNMSNNSDYTAVLEETEQEYKSKCQTVSFEEIMRSTNGMEGTRVTFQGRVTQSAPEKNFYVIGVNDNEQGIINKEYVVFTCDKDRLSENLLEGDKVAIYGTSEGLKTMEATVFKIDMTLPYVHAYYVERLN